jgi:hypothetical protein
MMKIQGFSIIVLALAVIILAYEQDRTDRHVFELHTYLHRVFDQ